MNLDSEMLKFVVVAIAAIGIGWLLLKVGKTIAYFLLALGGLIVVGIIGLALLEQARATRAAVSATAIAATGQAASSSIALVIILFLLIVLIGGAAVAYLYFRRWKRRWAPGPNAYWGQMPDSQGAPQAPVFPPYSYQYPPVLPYVVYPYPPYYPSYPTTVYPPDYGDQEQEEEGRLALPPWWD